MKIWWLAPLMLSVASGFSSITHANPKDKIIYIVRHGEKIDGNVGLGELGCEAQCLSEKGWARSYNLKSVFGTKHTSARPDLEKPEAIFSCNYAEPLDCRDHNGMFRTQQLVAAVAHGLNLPVDNSTGFIPSLCGMVWNKESKQGYMDHKIGNETAARKQPPKYREMFEEWLKAEPECDPADCEPQPQDGIAGKFQKGTSCHVRGFGPGDDKETNAANGTCCNQHAAGMMLKKLDEVDYILVGWEHANINYLAASLAKMAPPPPSPPPSQPAPRARAPAAPVLCLDRALPRGRNTTTLQRRSPRSTGTEATTTASTRCTSRPTAMAATNTLMTRTGTRKLKSTSTTSARQQPPA